MSTLSVSPKATFVAKWIISGREDLTWFIGSSLVSYLVLGLLAAGFPATPIYLIWLVGIDGPHVWATATRTYLDGNARRKMGLLLWVVAPALALGPLMVAAGAERVFYLFAVTWLHYHIAKQHFGFVALYKHKARERADFKLDRYFLLSSLMLPYCRAAVKTLMPGLYAVPAVETADAVVLGLYGCLAAYFVVEQVRKWKNGTPLNVPKLMLLGVVIPLQWLAFGYAATTADGIMRAGIVLGLFHSFQYHRLMWFHNHNYYCEGGGDAGAGVAGTLARRLVYYLGAAILLHLVLQYLPTQWSTNGYFKAAMWGIPFTHYILDSKIWRVRGNQELASALRLA